MLRSSLGLVALLFLSACGSSSGSGGAGGSAGGGGSGGTGGTGGAGGGMVTDDFVAGGARPVTVQVPDSYDPGSPAPLLILLHGYSAGGLLQDIYFGMTAACEAKGVVYAFPDGTTDGSGNKFWNATDACCDFGATGVDDVGYLEGLVDEIASKVSIDPKRVYFAGHSNGGFMSYRMGCAAADKVAAIVSLAGATFADDADCGATEPVSVAQLHGTADGTILYGGSDIGLASYPAAEDGLAMWAARGGCSGVLTATGETMDLDLDVPGEETTVLGVDGCPAGLAYELWRMEGSGHIPGVPQPEFADAVVDWLLGHPKP